MKLEIIEKQGGNYHIVELEEPVDNSQDLWYFDEYKDTDLWCEQTFGPQDIWGRDIITGWKRMRNRYYFVGEDKLNWFVLRWS